MNIRIMDGCKYPGISPEIEKGTTLGVIIEDYIPPGKPKRRGVLDWSVEESGDHMFIDVTSKKIKLPRGKRDITQRAFYSNRGGGITREEVGKLFKAIYKK